MPLAGNLKSGDMSCLPKSKSFAVKAATLAWAIMGAKSPAKSQRKAGSR